MTTHIEKDTVTGRDTTGHDWDGVRELNTPLPKWWLYTFFVCIVVAFVQFLLYPSIPFINGYWHGLLNTSERGQVTADVAAITARRAVFMDQIKTLPFDNIRANPELSAMAQTAGRVAFADNCQPCHGAGGGGRPGYPALAAGAWIWGGTADDIAQTITVGIRGGHPDARESQMPQFGADALLKPAEIDAAADHVLALYGKPAKGADVAPGDKVFADHCAACHGEAGQGVRNVGGPTLASKVHLYGDTRDDVLAQINRPRMGVMPSWSARLDTATIKSLALYVHALGGGEQDKPR